MERKYDKQREALYASMSIAAYGTFYSYRDIRGIMSLDPKTYRHVIISVQKRLEKNVHRTLRCDRGDGYSVAMPQEHLDLGQKHHRKAKRNLKRATSIIASTSRKDLDENDRRRVDNVEQCLLAQQDAIRHLEGRQTILEKRQINMSAEVEQKLSDVLARLSVLEHKDNPQSARHGSVMPGEVRPWQGHAGPGMDR